MRVRPKGLNAALADVFGKWIDSLPAEVLETKGVSSRSLHDSMPRSYVMYKPLLLLPKSTLLSEHWRRLDEGLDRSYWRSLFAEVAAAFDVTHIAIEGAIPLSYDDSEASANVLRVPLRLRFVHGDAGPLLTRSPQPTDYDEAFWISVKQHGIYQSYAPRYTMFSQGNITEKKRILEVASNGQHLYNPAQSTAVDLYAGIGYFVFPYAKAGLAKVLGWELNPWSVEGLRKGALSNRLKTKIYRSQEIHDQAEARSLDGEATVVIFEEDNANALRRIKAQRESIPPVRHINCGLLPTSEAVWETSVKMIDPVLGGWIHVHENIASKLLDERTREILSTFTSFAAPRDVRCEHVEQVKSYGPGIVHCVLDLHIGTARS